jgi:uronate dehydrogenase
MAKVIITGAKGTIGSVLMNGLQLTHELRGLDLPESDIRDVQVADRVFTDADAIVHLAWGGGESFKSGTSDVGNITMVENVYAAALRNGIPRVIVASSVHVDDRMSSPTGRLLGTNEITTPNSLYGVSKLHIEALGRFYASKGLEVIALRFGGINPLNQPPTHGASRRWLSHDDCASLLEACISAKDVPSNYSCVWAMSDNVDRYHSLDNPFGWKPQARSGELRAERFPDLGAP